MDNSTTDDVRDFFDRQQLDKQYESLKRMTRALDMEAARLLNKTVQGDVLTVGGIWDHFLWGEQLASLTVLDLSSEMLKVYCPEGAKPVVGDLYSYDFPPRSFDSIVFPLMLHHTAQDNWRTSQSRITQAVGRASRWLREGGRLIILEGCPNPAWIPLQRALLPVSKRFLARYKQPLVVMQSLPFYERTLRDRFGSSSSRPVHPDGFNFWKWYPIFMSIRWLRMPFALYPKLYVITAPAVAG